MARLYANEGFRCPLSSSYGDSATMSQQSPKPAEQTSLFWTMQFGVSCSEQRAVLTLTASISYVLHGEQPAHHGIIVCTFDRDFIGQAHRLHAAIEAHEPLAGLLIRLNRPA